MSYNINAPVKYHEIEEELCKKVDDRDNQQLDDDDYTKEDVLDICDHLFREELLGAFFLDAYDESELGKCFEYLFEIMMKNESFNRIVRNVNVERNDEEFLKINFVSLFSKDSFYITHKCVCSQIKNGTIGEELLTELKRKLEFSE